MQFRSVLDDRERRILLWIAQGLTYEAIGRKEHLSERRIRNLTLGMFNKLGAKNPAQLVAQAFIKHEISEFDISPTPTDSVTYLERRELEVLALIAKNYQPQDIQRKLGISEEAYRVYSSQARKKLRVTTNTDAVKMAMRKGLLK